MARRNLVGFSWAWKTLACERFELCVEGAAAHAKGGADEQVVCRAGWRDEKVAELACECVALSVACLSVHTIGDADERIECRAGC